MKKGYTGLPQTYQPDSHERRRENEDKKGYARQDILFPHGIFDKAG
jgi:hypothetical protein